MQKVVTINLNGNPYQLEEPGYEALRAYLESAQARLRDNPDRAEIMADLEQAIAEKCARFLGPHKTVVSTAEIDRIIAEMGPVENAGAAGATPDSKDQSAGAHDAGAPKRLYQIREGAMLSGVCNGIAAYINVDVTLIRIIFVLLAFVTAGLWILVYIALACIIPYADTSEERAAAYGLPFSAQELIDQAKSHHARFRARHEWRHEWRRQQRAWHRHWHRHWRTMNEQARTATASAAPAMGYAARAVMGITLPLLAILSAALFVAWAFALMSLFTTHTVFGWPVPAEIPFWGAVLILIALYAVVSAPLRAARHGGHLGWDHPEYGAWAALHGVFWLGFTLLFFWLAFEYIPLARALIEHLPGVWNHATSALTV
jgi:phage shock protein PspC (stress-responsive transcriptional regulator)